MQELYATTFTLAGLGDAAPFDIAAERLSQWAWERVGQQVDMTVEGPGTITNGDRELAWWRIHDETLSASALSMSFAHPDLRDASTRWRTAVTVSHQHAATRVTVRLSREAVTHLLRPGSFAMRPPAIVALLLDAPLRGYAGAIELHPVAHRLTQAQAADYVPDVLQHEQRVLPVVVVADESFLGIQASELARRLAGLAHVTYLCDRGAYEAFVTALPAGMSVPPGGVRIYWPGFGLPADSTHHRYWTRSSLRSRQLDAELRRMLARLSVARVPTDPLPGRIQQSAARGLVQALRAEATTAVSDAQQDATERLQQLQGQYDKLEEEALGFLARNEQLEADVLAAQSEREELAARLATTEQNLKATYAWKEETEDEEIEESEEPPDSWSQLRVRLEALISPGFQLTERALQCPESNNYPSPERMWTFLERLARAADAYNANSAQIGQRVAEWAVQFELDIALTDNSYATTEFEFEGVTLDRLPHVKIDDAVAPNQVGRIYFAIDSANARFVVDWFGPKQDRPTT